MPSKIACLAALLLSSVVCLATDIEIEPESPEVAPGRVVVLTAKTEGKVVQWLFKDDGLDWLPVEILKDSKTAVVNAPATAKPGKYRLIAVTAIGDKPAWAERTITVVGSPPPPGPPPPLPVPPIPDVLPQKLREAYLADKSPGKRGQLVNLIGIYSAMADHAATDPSITTSLALLDVLNKVKAGMLVDGVLMDLRRLVSAEISATLGPPSNAPLDREKAAGMFRRIVKSLPTPE